MQFNNGLKENVCYQSSKRRKKNLFENKKLISSKRHFNENIIYVFSMMGIIWKLHENTSETENRRKEK